MLPMHTHAPLDAYHRSRVKQVCLATTAGSSILTWQAIIVTMNQLNLRIKYLNICNCTTIRQCRFAIHV